MRRTLAWGNRASHSAIIVLAVVAAVAGAAAGWRLSQHRATLPQASCGAATTHSLSRQTVILAADHGALACFAQAARICRPASVRITEVGLDGGTDYVFTSDPGSSPCQITERYQDYSAISGRKHNPVSEVSCRLTAVTGSGVTLRCSGQEVLIPAKAGP